MPYFTPFIDEDGIHLPTYEERMENLLDAYRAAFGDDVHLDADSPDYQLMSVFARALDDMGSAMQDAYNSRNPQFAYADSLDHLVSVSGIRRRSGTHSTATLTLTGIANSSLRENMEIMDSNGYIWRIEDPVTFDSTGNATATAVCTEIGAINADAGTITKIMTPTRQWRTATNASPSVVGLDVESDADLRDRFSAASSLPSRSIIDGIRAGLENVPGVRYVNVVDNPTDSAVSGIPAHSIFCVVDASADSTEIARTILLKKAPGVGTHGNTSVQIEDAYGNATTIKYQTPTTKTVPLFITLRKLSGWDSSMENEIKQAVQSYVNSLRIGDPLIVSAVYAAAFTANKGDKVTFAISSIHAQTSSGTTESVSAGIDEMIRCGTITLTVQQ